MSTFIKRSLLSYALILGTFISGFMDLAAASSYVALRVSSGSQANNFVNIRKSPGGEVLATVQEHDFELIKENAVRLQGLNWHEVKLQNGRETRAYVAAINNVYLISGILHFPKGSNVILRQEPVLLKTNVVATLQNPSAFDVLEITIIDGVTWYKILARDLNKEKIAYIAEPLDQSKKPTYITDKAAYRDWANQRDQGRVFNSACPAGTARFGYLRSNQFIFQWAEVSFSRFVFNGKPQAIIIPRGARLKLVPVDDGKQIASTNGFLPFELVRPTSAGFDTEIAYVKRSEVKISADCAVSGVEQIFENGLQHWGGSEYRSFSVPARATNISLAIGRLDGQKVKSDKEFSFLEKAVFPFELNDGKDSSNLNSDSDQMGCGPGTIFNALGYSSQQGFCRPFLHGNSTTLHPIYAGGICGVSTLIHRSVFSTGLPITRYHNHGFYYESVYGLNDEIYNLPGGEGTEAEVAWDSLQAAGRDSSGYRFFNDSHKDLQIVTSVWYTLADDVTHATLQFWGAGEPDRTTSLSPVAIVVPDEKYQWTRTVEYHQAPTRQIGMGLKNLITQVNGNIRNDTTRTHYNCQIKKDGSGKEILDSITQMRVIDCYSQPPNFVSNF